VNGKALAAGWTVGGHYPGATDGKRLLDQQARPWRDYRSATIPRLTTRRYPPVATLKGIALASALSFNERGLGAITDLLRPQGERQGASRRLHG